MSKQRKKPAKPPLKLARVALAILILLAVLVPGAAAVLPVRQCWIVGQSRYTEREYAEAMGLGRGRVTLFTLNKAEISKGIRSTLPYANATRISRVYPCMVRVYVRDEKPAYAQEQDGVWWVLSENGRLLEASGPQPKGLLVLTGLALTEPGIGLAAHWKGSRAKGENLAALAQELNASPLRKDITGLRVTSGPVPDAVYQGRLRLRFGAPPPNPGMLPEEILREKLRLAQQTIAELNQQNPKQRGVVDLSIMGQCYFSAEWN
ncbi:MAG: hypothetical protein LBG83_01580 [Oscillospiraceae bacterium]|jgi:hypothetical protein|nr:hypothetical protein [Oscillospiraceae bacterium]